MIIDQTTHDVKRKGKKIRKTCKLPAEAGENAVNILIKK